MSARGSVLSKSFIEQSVARLIDGGVVACYPDAPVHEIALLLRAENCGALVVNSIEDQIVGIVSERDIITKRVDWNSSVAKDIMTRNPQVIRKSGSIARALHMMSLGGFRHLPVVHRNLYVEGVLSVKDVVRRIYDLLMKYHIGEKCEQIGDAQPIQRYFCKSISSLPFHKPVAHRPDASVADIINSLRSSRSGAVVLVDDTGLLQGIFTDRDYIQAVVGRELNLEREQIADFMTERPYTASPEESVFEVYARISSGGFRNLPVVSDGRVVGMLSIKDFLDVLVRELLEELTGV